MPLTPSARAVEQARCERVGEIVARLKADSFDAARYESTPRRRAEVLAAVLSKALSRGQMRRRLKSLGVSAQYSGGTLTAISVEGGGLDVRRADGRGQVLTGPGLDARLLEVFPELLPHTLTNLTFNASPAAGDTDISIANPSSSGTQPLLINLTLWLAAYLASAAVAHYTVTVGDTTLPSPTTIFGTFTISDPYGSTTLAGGGPEVTLYAAQAVSFSWSAAGLNWLEINATSGSATPGNKSISCASITDPGSYGIGLHFVQVVITYTNPPCLTCTLVLEASHGCTGAGLGGVLLTLSNGLNCTTNGSGECTISGIPDGDYTYTLTKTGYVSENGSFSCVCLTGGTTVISVSIDPVGGCKPPPDPNPEEPNGRLALLMSWQRRWGFYYAEGPVRVTKAYRRTDGGCDEHGGVSVSATGLCADTGGVSTSEDGLCAETGGISTDADGGCDETGGVTAT